MRFDYRAADHGVIAKFNEGRNTTFDRTQSVISTGAPPVVRATGHPEIALFSLPSHHSR
jgi:hypothetical protein